MTSTGTGFLTGTGDGGKPRTQEEKLSRDARAVFYGFLLLSVAGLVFVTIDQWGPTASAALLWSMACLAIGSLVGFLFGIPRVLQADQPANPSPSSAASSSSAPAGPSLKVNTNLEQISDWLTKIFVGLGLVQLQRVPDHLRRASEFVAWGLAPDSKFFAGGLILYFTVLGFLGFYLLTRLYIAGAFGRADKEASGIDPDIATLQAAPSQAAGDSGITSEERQAARRVASRPLDEISSQSGGAAAWAKAQLSLGQYSQAIDAYSKLVAESSDDLMLRLEYAGALFHKGDRASAKTQLLEAHKRITSTTSKDQKERLYAALSFQPLYETPPTGFEESIKYGEEYVSDTSNQQSGRIWLNLACAYGQRMTWLIQNDPANADSRNDTRSKALNAVKRAAALRPAFKERLLELLQHDYPNKVAEENDLEVFERDNEFREALDLPLVNG